MQKFLHYMLIVAFMLPMGAFAESTLPAVQSKLAKNITHNTADIYATVAPGTAEDNSYWFEWGVVGTYEDTVFKTYRRTIGTRGGPREVNASIRGLNPDTQYYFRIIGENQKGSTEGERVYFTTRKLEERQESVVLVTTRNALDVKDESATIYGYVAPHNATARYWFEWGIDNKVEFRTSSHLMGKDGGEVESDLTSLVSGTTYYYRVAAENDRGTVRSEIKTFKTTGVKPTEEAKKNQTSAKADTKTTKTADGTDAKKTSSNSGIFGSLFGGSSKKTTDTTEEKTTTTKEDLTGSVGNSVKDVTVTVKAAGTAGAHQTVEYKISYKYNRAEAGKKAELKVTLPKSVVYIGDTTANELLVADATGGARTYILPIGDIKKGDTRSFSLVGMLTADAKKIPQIDAKLSFTTKAGTRVTAGSLVAGAASASSGGSFPGTLIMWLIVLNLLVVAAIFAVKAKEWYADAKIRMAEAQNKANDINAQIDAPIKTQPVVPGAVVGVPPVSTMEQPIVPMMPIPMKPKIADVYAPARFSEVGLPGMEIVA